MKRLNAAKIAIVVFGILASITLTVTGCSPAVTPSTEDSPYPVSEVGYDVTHIQMENGVIATCFEDGGYGNRVLTCFEGSQDFSGSTIPIADTEYKVTYVDAGHGVTTVCFEDGGYDNRVLTCFPYTR